MSTVEGLSCQFHLSLDLNDGIMVPEIEISPANPSDDNPRFTPCELEAAFKPPACLKTEEFCRRRDGDGGAPAACRLLNLVTGAAILLAATGNGGVAE
jgi:hypothetical protein